MAWKLPLKISGIGIQVLLGEKILIQLKIVWPFLAFHFS